MHGRELWLSLHVDGWSCACPSCDPCQVPHHGHPDHMHPPQPTTTAGQPQLHHQDSRSLQSQLKGILEPCTIGPWLHSPRYTARLRFTTRHARAEAAAAHASSPLTAAAPAWAPAAPRAAPTSTPRGCCRNWKQANGSTLSQSCWKTEKRLGNRSGQETATRLCTSWRLWGVWRGCRRCTLLCCKHTRQRSECLLRYVTSQPLPLFICYR